jgi:hypothetical protein
LGFKIVFVTPLTFVGTNLATPWIILFIPLAFSFVKKKNGPVCGISTC